LIYSQNKKSLLILQGSLGEEIVNECNTPSMVVEGIDEGWDKKILTSSHTSTFKSSCCKLVMSPLLNHPITFHLIYHIQIQINTIYSLKSSSAVERHTPFKLKSLLRLSLVFILSPAFKLSSKQFPPLEFLWSQ